MNWRTMTWFRDGRPSPRSYRTFVLVCGVNRAWAVARSR